MSGYYVSLRPRGLEVYGDDLHITLAYLGKLDESKAEEVRDYLSAALDGWDGLEAETQGVAQWIAGTSYYSVILIGGWPIHVLQKRVSLLVEDVGLEASKDYPYLPHVTIDEARDLSQLWVPGLLRSPVKIQADNVYFSRDDEHTLLRVLKEGKSS